MTCIAKGSRRFGLVCLTAALMTLPAPANDVAARPVENLEIFADGVPDHIAKQMARNASRSKPAKAAKVKFKAIEEESPTLARLPACNKFGAQRIQVGLASWYGADFHGRKTAGGERYDMHELTAAHRTLPLNTEVRVINKRTGKSIVLRINDRGPYAHGRVIDLSYAAAEALNIRRRGVAKVEIEVLCKPDHEQKILLLPPKKPAII